MGEWPENKRDQAADAVPLIRRTVLSLNNLSVYYMEHMKRDFRAFPTHTVFLSSTAALDDLFFVLAFRSGLLAQGTCAHVRSVEYPVMAAE